MKLAEIQEEKSHVEEQYKELKGKNCVSRILVTLAASFSFSSINKIFSYLILCGDDTLTSNLFLFLYLLL